MTTIEAGSHVTSQELAPSDGETSRTVQRIDALFIGPLPSPGMMAKYEAIEPGFAMRIVTMAETEAGHRHTMETAKQKSEHTLAARGQMFGFLILMTFIVGGSFLAATDHLAAGFLALTASVLGAIGAALRGRAGVSKSTTPQLPSRADNHEEQKPAPKKKRRRPSRTN